METGIAGGNQCGGCTLCCRVMGVLELEKPMGKECQHCTGHGCGIYADRPPSCREFECLWLSSGLPQELRPDRSHVVLNVCDNGDTVIAQLDEDYAGQAGHREPLMWVFLSAIVKAGKVVPVYLGGEMHELLYSTAALRATGRGHLIEKIQELVHGS